MGWPDWINRDASGNRILNLDKVPLIQNAVNAACDELDGVKDGIIDDPRRCTWDPLDPSQNYIKICTAGDASDCLTVEQAKIVQKIYDAPRDKSGNIIFPAARPRGAETGWASIIGTGTNPSVNGGLYVLPALQYAVFDPDPGPTYKLFDFPCNFDGCDAAAVAELSKYAPIYNASSTRLDGFKLRNGKMIMYGGWSTAGAQPQALVYYYDKVAQRMGSDVPDYFRLYMIPGMAHCSAASGIGPTNADFAQFFPQLEAWVEKGIAPEEVVTTSKKGAVPTRTRLLCPYPQVAKYKGTAYDSDKAESFTCAYPDYPLQAQEWDGIDLFPWDVPEGIVWH
jgi:feruloyl esterase